MIKGHVYHSTALFGYMMPLTGLYVHPVTKKLGYIPKVRRAPKRKDPNIKILCTNHELRRVEGIWFYYEFTLVTKYRWVQGATTLLREPDGTEIKLLSKHQLGKKELKRYGVENENIISRRR
jgi:hypothetical protein